MTFMDDRFIMSTLTVDNAQLKKNVKEMIDTLEIVSINDGKQLNGTDTAEEKSIE